MTTEPPAPAEPPAPGEQDPVGPAPAPLRRRPRRRRSRRGAAAAGFVMVAVVALGAVAVTREAMQPGPAASSTASEPAAAPVRTGASEEVDRLAAMDQLLLDRSAALLARDEDDWMATVDPASTAFAARQAQMFANLAQVPFDALRMEYAGEGPALSAERAAEVGPGAWVARVSLAYRLADADVADVRRDRYLTFVQRGGDWLVADDADGGKTLDVWDLGPVAVVRGERSLVLGTGDPALLEELAERSDRAARAVDEVWGEGWPRTAVVVVPADQGQMAALLDRPDETGLEQIAAVTTGEVGAPSGPAADRIIVNPAGFAQLRDVGPDVVLTHEMAHVAVRASGPGQGPLWVSEGFADLVGYSGHDLSRRQVAGDVLGLVADGAGPTGLPTDADFDPRQGDIAPAYSASWLAIDLLDRTYGREALLRFVDLQVGTFTADGVEGRSPVPVEEAVRTAFGVELATFEAQWLEHLDALAG